MIVIVVDLTVVWCVVTTAAAVVYINPSELLRFRGDVPVYCSVNSSAFYVTFTQLMPNICSPVIRKETDNQIVVSQCF